MRDAVIAYNKRYYGGKGKEILKDLVGIELPDQEQHDISHILVSGIANLNMQEKSLLEQFAFLDENGLVARNAGLKAELLQYIYDNGVMLGSTTSLEQVKSYYQQSLPIIFARYVNGKDGNKLSKVPELGVLLSSYNGIHTKFENIITPEEIEFHVQKASDLYDKLNAEHPDCFNKGFPDYEKLLDLDLKEFAIDNFTMAEKIKLRGANLGASANKGR